MYSELQELDLLRSETQDRFIAERHHWKNKLEFTNNKQSALLSKCNDEVKAKDARISKLEEENQALKQSLKSQAEDIDCMRFDHRLNQRDLRKKFNSLVDAKKNTIKTVYATLVDQQEMTYEMLDEVKQHNTKACYMKRQQTMWLFV
jgi:hypothetical protein